MKKVYEYRPTQRLVAIMRTPGGLTVDQALSDAQRRMETLRESCVASLDAKIEAISGLQTKLSPSDLRTLYALATEIYSLAGTFGLTELSQAAASLAELVADYRRLENPGADATKLLSAIDVHLGALRTLRRVDLSTDECARAAVIEGLRSLTKIYRSHPAAP